MPVQIDTTTPRLSNFEAGVLAELARLQCREAELVATIQEMQKQAEERQDGESSAADALAEHNTRLETQINEVRAELDALRVEHAQCPTVEVAAEWQPIRLAE